MQPDTEYSLVECRLREPLDASLSLQFQSNPDVLLFALGPKLRKGIENLEKFRKYRIVEYVPGKKWFNGKAPCCDAMRQPAGSPLKLRIEPAGFQGDTNDATNFDEESDPDKRLNVDGLMDWIVVAHFWTPVMSFNTQGYKEEKQAAETEGFLSWNQMPEDIWPVLRKRFAQNGND